MSEKFTREDKNKLDHKRALNPVLSAGAAGASGAALAANLGGSALRNVGQKKVFDSKLNDYTWVNRAGASANKMKAARLGSKLQAKAIPITLAAGGINAVTAANGIGMSKLWNKKDKVQPIMNPVAKSRFGKLVNRSVNNVSKAYTYTDDKTRRKTAAMNVASGAALTGAGVLGLKAVTRGIGAKAALGLAAKGGKGSINHAKQAAKNIRMATGQGAGAVGLTALGGAGIHSADKYGSSKGATRNRPRGWE